MSFIEQYRKYLLIALIIVSGCAIFTQLTPFLGGLLGAFTIYILVRNQMTFLVCKRRFKKALAASLILVEVILFFLVPLSMIALILVDRISNIDINPQQLLEPLENLAAFIKTKTGYDLLKTENLMPLISQVPRVGQYVVNQASSFFINVLVLLFALYFMLTGGKKMEKYIYEILPFSEENKKIVLHETNIIVTSNAIGIPVLGIIQGVIALLGYYVFDVPTAMFFGFLTAIATIMPVIGTALIWVPLSIYLAAIGQWGNGIGLLAYGILIISQVDNFVRFILQKKLADIHPLITIFGVVIGFTLFGFMGVIFGPLLLSMFLLFFNIFKKEYLDKSR